MRLLIATTLLLLVGAAPAWAPLHAAVLPSSGTVQAGRSTSAFATIVNAGPATATDCSITPPLPCR